jgi:hypothetical protein
MKTDRTKMRTALLLSNTTVSYLGVVEAADNRNRLVQNIENE